MMIKNYLKGYGYLICLIVIMTLILSIISYFFNSPLNIMKVSVPLISLFVASIILGKNTKEKAYIEGIKFTGIYILITIIFKLIFNTGFNYNIILIYILMLVIGIMGAMIGINIKKK